MDVERHQRLRNESAGLVVDLKDADWTMNKGRRKKEDDAKPAADDVEEGTTEMPATWKRRHSQEHDREFFVNEATGETSWDLPKNGRVEPLPSGWKRRFSAEHGKHYYANDTTGASVWTPSEIPT